MNSPKNLTREDIIALVVGEEYHLHGLTTICVLTTSSGFTVTADTTAADPDTFSEEKGRRYALDLAIDKLFPFEVYAQGRMREIDSTVFVDRLVEYDPNKQGNNPNEVHLRYESLSKFALRERAEAAMLTLERRGYTHRGGVEWAPPIGKPNPLQAEQWDVADMEAFAATDLQPLALNKLAEAVKEGEAMLAGEGRHHTKETAGHLAKKLAAAFKAEEQAEQFQVRDVVRQRHFPSTGEAEVLSIENGSLKVRGITLSFDALWPIRNVTLVRRPQAQAEELQVGDIVTAEGEAWAEAEVTKAAPSHHWYVLRPNGDGPELMYSARRLKLLRRPKPAAEQLQVGDIVKNPGSAGEWTVLRVLGDGFCKVESNRGESFHVLATHLKLLRRPQAEPEAKPLLMGDIVHVLGDPRQERKVVGVAGNQVWTIRVTGDALPRVHASKFVKIVRRPEPVVPETPATDTSVMEFHLLPGDIVQSDMVGAREMRVRYQMGNTVMLDDIEPQGFEWSVPRQYVFFVRRPPPVESGPLTDEAGPVAGEAEKADYVVVDLGGRPRPLLPFVGAIASNDGMRKGGTRTLRSDGQKWHEDRSACRVIGAFVQEIDRPDTDVPSPAELNDDADANPIKARDIKGFGLAGDKLEAQYVLKASDVKIAGLSDGKTRITPTIGRRVWFYPNGSTESGDGSDMVMLPGADYCDAGICYVHPDGKVNLVLTDHTGICRWGVTECLLLMPDEPAPAPGPDAGYARWMPYQAGKV